MFNPSTRRLIAGIAIFALALGLGLALIPYLGGLLGGPMLYVLWAPFHSWLLRRRIPSALAATIIIILTLLLVVLPGTWLVTMLVGQAQGAAQALTGSAMLDRLEQLRIGTIEIGPYLANLGETLIGWVGGNALAVLGTAARVMLNVVFSLFGLYFLLVHPGSAWAVVEPYLPFSKERSVRLRDRFTAVTLSTVIGTGLIAVVQGFLVGGAFWVTGISNAAFWGAVTAVLSILPLVGSGLVWAPGAIGLYFQDEVGKAIGLLLWGLVVVSNVDNILRPLVYNRFARIHPMITLVGAIVGVEQAGFIGIILGPLAISYFFELTSMYAQEFSGNEAPVAAASGPVVADVPAEEGAGAPGDQGAREPGGLSAGAQEAGADD